MSRFTLVRLEERLGAAANDAIRIRGSPVRSHPGARQVHVNRTGRILRDTYGQRRTLRSGSGRFEFHANRARRIAGQRQTASASRDREIAGVGAADPRPNRNRER